MAQGNDKDISMAKSVEFPEELKTKARVFFAKGAETAYTLNYEYAIELYLDGLALWPDALEDGHKPLREVALRRQAAGKKKSGFGDSSRYKKMPAKTAKEQMVKAEYLLSKEPANLSHMADMVKSAAEGGFRETAEWMADMLFERNRQKDKPSLATYILLRDSYSQVESYARAFQACQQALALKPKDTGLQQSLRDLSVQTTMQQGRYDDESDFRDSIRDRDEQTKRQSQEHVVRSDTAKTDMISQARQEYEADPQVPGKIFKLIDALCDTEQEDKEQEAIGILEKAYVDSPQFSYKQRGGDIHIKQLNRQLRRLQSQENDEQTESQIRKANADLLAAELEHYKLCVANYPTDLKLKYEYGRRLMKNKEYDKAIPQFQEARSDPRFKLASLNCIGQSFYYKQWYTDAVETFEMALENLDDSEGAVAKELRYNLGRAHEADGNMDEALNCFRKVAQIDFNYRDVKERVNTLRQKQNNEKK